MAITVTNKTSGRSDSATTSHVTASVSPTASAILLVSFCSTAAPSGISGMSLTWTLAGSVAFFSGGRHLYVYWALVPSSPSSGAITVMTPIAYASWVVDEVAGSDSDGPIQIATNTASSSTTVAATLGTLRGSDSVNYSAFGTNLGGSWTPEGGATETADPSTTSSPRCAAHHKANDVTLTGTNSQTSHLGTVALELGISAYVKTGKGSSALKGSGIRGSGGIVMTKAGKGSSAFRAAGYKMPVSKSGKASSALKASGGYLERDVGVTKYLEAAILTWLFNGGTLTAPASLYLGLFTAAPDTVAGGTECSGNGYARARFANAIGSWDEAASATKTLVTCVGFPIATGSWGTVVAIGLWDASSGGNLWAWRPVSPTFAISSGELAVVEPGDFAVVLD